VTNSLHWQQRVGSQRDWVWRGWQTRYTYIRATQGGREPPLILLHGFGASLGHWRYNLPELGQHHTVYALDMLGFGASEKAVANYGVELWIEQVYDFWCTCIRTPVVLVGNSIGSLVCLAAAVAHPDMVQGVVMLNLPDSSVLESPRWLQGAIAPLQIGLRPILRLATCILTFPPLFSPLFWVVRHPRAIRVWAKQAYADPSLVTDELVEILSSPAYDRGAMWALRAMIHAKTGSGVNYTAKVVLPGLQIPLLLFWGKQDMMVPAKLARLFVKHNPRLKLIEIENAGHCPHDECPDLVNQEILNWIATL